MVLRVQMQPMVLDVLKPELGISRELKISLILEKFFVFKI